MTEAPRTAASRWSRQVIGPFTLRHIAILAVVLLVAAAALSVLTTPISTPEPVPESPGSGFFQTGERTTGLAIGQLAPELEGEDDGETVVLSDLDGDVISLEALRGSPVWINFFATWCPPCQEETPVLRDTYAEYRDDGLELVAISVQESTPADVADYADTYSLDYTIGFDATGAVFDTYQGYGLPTHVLIDADGVIVQLIYGPVDRETASSLIEPLLGSAG
ncbi:MAG: TlpA disulfide reductase family protein [Candidatus Limnocylindrales bacterium]